MKLLQRRCAPITMTDPGDHHGAIGVITMGGIRTAIGGGRVMDFPLTLFEAKSASQLEAVIAEFRMSDNPPSTEIALPQDMREFFAKERFSVPPRVRFFTEVAQLGRILAAVRVRVLTYIRSLP